MLRLHRGVLTFIGVCRLFCAKYFLCCSLGSFQPLAQQCSLVVWQSIPLLGLSVLQRERKQILTLSIRMIEKSLKMSNLQKELTAVSTKSKTFIISIKISFHKNAIVADCNFCSFFGNLVVCKI
jgi:hypothetical protein